MGSPFLVVVTPTASRLKLPSGFWGVPLGISSGATQLNTPCGLEPRKSVIELLGLVAGHETLPAVPDAVLAAGEVARSQLTVGSHPLVGLGTTPSQISIEIWLLVG